MVSITRRALTTGCALILPLLTLARPAPVRADNSWTLAGPNNCTGVPGGCSGRTTSLARNPADENVIYAGHASGGLWKTANFGGSWTCLLDGGVGAMAFRPSSGGGSTNRLLAGLGTGNRRGDGIWTSDNDGVSWDHRLTLAETAATLFNAMAVDPGGAIVYTATSAGLYRSADAGNNWSLDPAFTGAAVIDVVTHPALPLMAFATALFPANPANSGLYRTINAGSTWKRVTDTDSGWLTATDWGTSYLAWAPNDPTYLYVIAGHSILHPTRPGKVAMVGRSHTTLASNVGGTNQWDVVWTDAGCGSGVICGEKVVSDLSALAVSPGDPLNLYFGSTFLYRSRDGGACWEVGPTSCSGSGVCYDRYHPDISFILPVADGLHDGFLLGTDGGVYYHDAWYSSIGCPATEPGSLVRTALNSNYYSLEMLNASVDPDPAWGNVVAGGTWDQGLWANDPILGAWRFMATGDVTSVALTNTCMNCGGLSGSSHVLYRANYGTPAIETRCDWLGNSSSNSTLLSGGSGQALIVTDVTSSTAVVYAFRGAELFKYVAGSCTPAPPSPFASLPAGTVVTAASFVPGVGSATPRIYAGTSNGSVFRIFVGASAIVMNITPTTSPTWTTVSPMPIISDVAVRPGATGNDDTIYVTLGARQYVNAYNVPQGNLWKRAANLWSPVNVPSLPHVPLLTVAVHPSDNNVMWVGGLHGTWWTQNAGTTWFSSRFNMPDVGVTELAYHPGSGLLYAATWGRSIWSSSPATWSTGISNAPARPRAESAPALSFELSTSTINYQVPSAGWVEIRLFDFSGRLIRTLVSDERDAGLHSFRLAVEGVAGGIYWARMSLDGRPSGATRVVIR